MRILVIEDDADQRDLLNDAAEEIDEIDITLEMAVNYQAAVEKLSDGEFDGAIVDLGLESGRPNSTEGNELLEKILNIKRFPVRVLTGNTNNIDESINNRESVFYKIYAKDEKDNIDVLKDFVGIYNTGITKLLSGRGDLEKKVLEIFWEHLSVDLGDWIGDQGSDSESLLRYILNHMIEYLSLSKSTSYFKCAEFYIIPPIRKFVSPGDVLRKKDNGELFLNLSPACDVAVRSFGDDGIPVINANRVSLVKLHVIKRDNLISLGVVGSEAKSKKAFETCLKKIISGKDPRLIYFPCYRNIPAAIADLRNLYSVNFKEEYLDEYDRLGTVSAPFSKDIQAKYSNYHGRQGAPAIDKDMLSSMHADELLREAIE